MIAEREERQDIRLERQAVRIILERLATEARDTADGCGRFSEQLLQQIFTEVTGGSADPASINVLLRLPFLRPIPDAEGYRGFVDRESADALRAGDVVRFIFVPHDSKLVDIVRRTER